MDFTTQDLQALFSALAGKLTARRDELCALDGAIGDGDHGIAMEQGMQAAAAAALANHGNLQDLFNAAAKAFLNAVGASCGPLYATGLLWAGKALGAQNSIPQDRLRDVIVAMRDGIAHRGKGMPGQKTMLDAWHPAAEAAEAGRSPEQIVLAAQAGAEATRDMVATLGRAARLGTRSLGHPDPGAVSACILIAEIATFLARPAR